MKLWGICAMTCLLAVVFRAAASDGYTASTNNDQRLIRWQHEIIYAGPATDVTISPDHQSVAWVEEHLAGFSEILDEPTPVNSGVLFFAHAGDKPTEIKRPTTSRGWQLPSEDPSINVVYRPENFQWDSGSRFLYYTTTPWITRRMLWQLRISDAQPRAIVPLTEFRLLKKHHGADWVEAYETNYEHQDFSLGLCIRDWTTTYVYAPEEMAAETYVRPERRGCITKEWPKH